MSGRWTPGPGPTNGDDSYPGTGGRNVVSGEGGDDTLRGEGDGDILSGEAGNDSLLGGTGNDVMAGGDGDDVLIGGAGDDVMAGGAGADTFYYNQGDGSDTIWGGTEGDQVLVYAPGGYSTTRDGIYTRVTFTETGESIDVDSASIVESEAPLPCFAEGTAIMTARGEIPVETLRAGDLVVASRGNRTVLAPILWLGHARVDIAAHPRREAVAPIRIGAGALGERMPAFDLRLSPEHALYIDGHLIPARLLVNGGSIVQEQRTARVTYWHVELEHHAVLVANGALAESYLDDGNRQNFDNAAVAALVKDFAPRSGTYAERACAPLLEGGHALDRIRSRIAARQAAMAPETRRA
jgi:hypothetical protein